MLLYSIKIINNNVQNMTQNQVRSFFARAEMFQTILFWLPYFDNICGKLESVKYMCISVCALTVFALSNYPHCPFCLIFCSDLVQ